MKTSDIYNVNYLKNKYPYLADNMLSVLRDFNKMVNNGACKQSELCQYLEYENKQATPKTYGKFVSDNPI